MTQQHENMTTPTQLDSVPGIRAFLPYSVLRESSSSLDFLHEEAEETKGVRDPKWALAGFFNSDNLLWRSKPKVYWVVLDRSTPVAPYPALIEGYHSRHGIDRKMGELAVDERFTEDELQALRSYLEREHGVKVCGREAALPLAPPGEVVEVSGYGKPFKIKANVFTHPEYFSQLVAEYDYGIRYCDLHEEAGYDLPFKVRGYLHSIEIIDNCVCLNYTCPVTRIWDSPDVGPWPLMNGRDISLAGLKVIDRDSYEVVVRLRSEWEQSQADDQQGFFPADNLPS